jgi:hypothetical protein
MYMNYGQNQQSYCRGNMQHAANDMFFSANAYHKPYSGEFAHIAEDEAMEQSIDATKMAEILKQYTSELAPNTHYQHQARRTDTADRPLPPAASKKKASKAPGTALKNKADQKRRICTQKNCGLEYDTLEQLLNHVRYTHVQVRAPACQASIHY